MVRRVPTPFFQSSESTPRPAENNFNPNRSHFLTEPGWQRPACGLLKPNQHSGASLLQAVHEVDFTAQVAGWVQAIVASNGADFPIQGARIENRKTGNLTQGPNILRQEPDASAFTGEVQFALSKGGVNFLGEAFQGNATLFQHLHRVDKLPHRPCQPVQLPNDNDRPAWHIPEL